MPEDLISKALRCVLAACRLPAGLIVHSDQGSQYPATRYWPDALGFESGRLLLAGGGLPTKGHFFVHGQRKLRLRPVRYT